jgi:hypothetical protein
VYIENDPINFIDPLGLMGSLPPPYEPNEEDKKNKKCTKLLSFDYSEWKYNWFEPKWIYDGTEILGWSGNTLAQCWYKKVKQGNKYRQLRYKYKCTNKCGDKQWYEYGEWYTYKTVSLEKVIRNKFVPAQYIPDGTTSSYKFLCPSVEKLGWD